MIARCENIITVKRIYAITLSDKLHSARYNLIKYMVFDFER